MDITRGKLTEITRTAIQEALQADNTKDTPTFGSQDLEKIHRAGTEAGLLVIYNFPGAVYAIDGSNDKRVTGAVSLQTRPEQRRMLPVGKRGGRQLLQQS